MEEWSSPNLLLWAFDLLHHIENYMAIISIKNKQMLIYSWDTIKDTQDYNVTYTRQYLLRPFKWFNKNQCKWIYNKGHNHSTKLHSIYWWKLYIKRLNHKGLVYKLNHPSIKENLTKECPPFTPELTSYSLKDYEFQQAKILVELHSFTFITIYLYSF